MIFSHDVAHNNPKKNYFGNMRLPLLVFFSPHITLGQEEPSKWAIFRIRNFFEVF